MATVTKIARARKPVATAPVSCPDIRVSNHGSVFLFEPTAPEAFDLLIGLVPPGEETHYFGHSLVVEHRYARAVADQLREDGLTVA